MLKSTAVRVGALPPSATLALMDRTRELKQRGLDVISFGPGEPDFDTPSHIIEAGVKSLKTLTEEEPISLADDVQIEGEKVIKWIEQAKNFLKKRDIGDSIDDLMRIKGMNRAYANKLVNFGITSVEDLSNEKADILSQDLKISDKIITVWIEAAMHLTGKPVPVKKKPVKKKEPEVPPKEELKEVKKKAPAKPKKQKPKEAKKKEAVKPEKEKPKEEKKKALTLLDLEGIGKADLKKFTDLGITKIENLIDEDPMELASITGINITNITQWIGDAREYLGLPREQEKPKEVEPEGAPAEPEAETEKDPLQEILKLDGVGKKTAEKLIAADLKTYEEIADCDPKEVSKKTKISERTLNKIIASAKEKLED